jgi:hypothetical protein
MRTKHIVGIAPTSFNMQSADSGTRMAISSEGISMFRATGNTEEQTVSLVSATGDATIVGTFSTGFAPDGRIEMSSGSSVPERIKFYSGAPQELSYGYIKSDVDYLMKDSTSDVAITSNNQRLELQLSSYTRPTGLTPTTATFTTSISHGFKTGESVIITSTNGCNTDGGSVVVTVTSTTQFTCIPNTTINESPISGSTGSVRKSRIYVSDTSMFSPTGGHISFGGAFVAFPAATKLSFSSKGSSDSSIVKNIFGSGTAGITGTGVGTRTATTTTAHGFQIGDTVYITGVTGIASEVAVVATLPTTSSFTYTSVNTGTRTGTGGTITLYPSLKECVNVTLSSSDGGYIVTSDDVYDNYNFTSIRINTGSVDRATFPFESTMRLKSIPKSTNGLTSTSEIQFETDVFSVTAPTVEFDTGAVDVSITSGGLEIDTIAVRGSARGIIAATSATILTTVTHGLGTTPISVVACARNNSFGGQSLSAMTGNFTSTTFTIFILNGSNTAVAAAASWIASA